MRLLPARKKYIRSTYYTPIFQSISIFTACMNVGCSAWVLFFSKLTRAVAMCFWRSFRKPTFSGTAHSVNYKTRMPCRKPRLTLDQKPWGDEACYYGRNALNNEDPPPPTSIHTIPNADERQCVGKLLPSADIPCQTHSGPDLQWDQTPTKGAKPCRKRTLASPSHTDDTTSR